MAACMCELVDVYVCTYFGMKSSFSLSLILSFFPFISVSLSGFQRSSTAHLRTQFGVKSSEFHSKKLEKSKRFMDFEGKVLR
jgi:hypothetical protein